MAYRYDRSYEGGRHDWSDDGMSLPPSLPGYTSRSGNPRRVSESRFERPYFHDEHLRGRDSIPNSEFLAPWGDEEYGRHRSKSFEDVRYGTLPPKDPHARFQPSMAFAERFEEYKPDSTELSKIRRLHSKCLDWMRDVIACCDSKAGKGMTQSNGITFGAIAKQLDNHRFRLKVWGVEVGIDEIRGLELEDDDTVSLILQTLGNITSCLGSLDRICSTATHSDLAVQDSELAGSESEGSDDDIQPPVTFQWVSSKCRDDVDSGC